MNDLINNIVKRYEAFKAGDRSATAEIDPTCALFLHFRGTNADLGLPADSNRRIPRPRPRRLPNRSASSTSTLTRSLPLLSPPLRAPPTRWTIWQSWELSVLALHIPRQIRHRSTSSSSGSTRCRSSTSTPTRSPPHPTAPHRQSTPPPAPLLHQPRPPAADPSSPTRPTRSLPPSTGARPRPRAHERARPCRRTEPSRSTRTPDRPRLPERGGVPALRCRRSRISRRRLNRHRKRTLSRICWVISDAATGLSVKERSSRLEEAIARSAQKDRS